MPPAAIPGAESAFATVLVPGVVGLSIMFQGIQAVAMPLAQEFGFTREIEDRVQAPCPIWLVAISKVISGGAQGLISAAIVLPIASVVHAAGVQAQINLHWLLILTLVPLSCICMASLGLLLGTSFEPRNLGLMFGFIVLPITFLGGTYYQWTRLGAGEGRPGPLAADHRADQPADLHQRRHAGRLHGCRAHAPLRDLPGHRRLQRDLPHPRACATSAARCWPRLDAPAGGGTSAPSQGAAGAHLLSPLALA